MAPWLVLPAVAEPVQRPTPVAGSVIARKTGEEVQFVDVSSWRYVDLHQDLLTGDVLRTNATGQLAVLFSDHTQVRLGRNSALQVRQMSATGDTVLDLQAGTIWARAQRGGQGLTVQTPAAAAAIRGTDWTMTVNGNQTSLIVLEGQVEFKNDLGSVQVAEGEAAVATIGQAPRKIVIVSPSDREQMLFYLTLRNGFTYMPASPLPRPQMRSERLRITAKPQETRSAEDWLTLAEVQYTANSRDETRNSLARARALRLSPAQRARADLVEALVAGGQTRYADAARLFAQAMPHLDPKRRSIAAYGGYYSRSMLDPNRVENPPADATGANGALMRAYTAGFLKNIPAALDILKQAERQYPDDPTLPSARALLAQLADDRVQMKDAIDRSLSIDPKDAYALLARARYRADYESDLEGALADVQQAIEETPGSSMNWNDLGMVQDSRGASREAEQAFKKSIELDPEDPVGHANLAILYLDQSRMKEAKREIDAALAAEPSYDLALLARGRYYLQTGERDKALDDLLASSTANPGYSNAQLLLAAAHYEKGDRDPSNQALDNADRLDKNDPVISSFRTAVAIDDYDADGAIRNAQEFLRRSRARGGDYRSLGANQDAGSTLNNAFRLQGLDAWGRYYGDAVFDPFEGTGYTDQSLKGTVNPVYNSFLFGGDSGSYTADTSSFSSLFQGLMLDPHMLSGRSRSASLLRTPFIEGSLGGGINAIDGHVRRIGQGEVQGYSNEPFPLSFLGNLSWEEIPTEGEYDPFGNFSTESNVLSGVGYLTASLTPDDRIVAYVRHAKTDINLDALNSDDIFGIGFPLPSYRIQTDVATSTSAGLGWSHTFGYQNVLNAAVFYTDAKAEGNHLFGADLQPLDPLNLPSPAVVTYGQSIEESQSRNYIGALSHSYGAGDLTWRYGIEGGWIDISNKTVAGTIPIPFLLPGSFSATDNDTHIDLARAYVDVLHEIQPNLKGEYALFATQLKGDGVDVQRLEPRFGFAWAPTDNHWLRAAFIRQGLDVGTPTLSPVGILGLQPNRFSAGINGYADTIALQWDAEWSDRFFTSVEYQHQDLHDFSIDYPLTSLALNSFTASEGRIDRASVTGNVVLGHGFGLSATYAYADSENNDKASPGFGGALPYIPEHSGQVALTWVNEANVKATVAANYIGERDGSGSGTQLDDYWTLDANLIWEPLDKRFALEAAAYNLLDEDFEVAPGVSGWGRAFKGTLKIRF